LRGSISSVKVSLIPPKVAISLPMCPAPDHGKPIVETSPAGDAEDVTHRSLRLRIRQQEILAELGVRALQGAAFQELLDETARLTAEGLQCDFCKVLQYVPSEKRL